MVYGMVKNRWLVKPLQYVANRFLAVARYAGTPELLSARLGGLSIDIMMHLREPWFKALGIRTIFDIGANTGQFAGAAARAFPAAQLYSFEPLPDCYAALAARLANVPRAKAINLGIGSETGE